MISSGLEIFNTRVLWEAITFIYLSIGRGEGGVEGVLHELYICYRRKEI